jgi:hypothetical protein
MSESYRVVPSDTDESYRVSESYPPIGGTHSDESVRVVPGLSGNSGRPFEPKYPAEWTRTDGRSGIPPATSGVASTPGGCLSGRIGGEISNETSHTGEGAGNLPEPKRQTVASPSHAFNINEGK